MKNKISLMLPLLLMVLSAAAAATPQMRGYTLTDLYTFEDASAKQHLQIYQTLSFRLGNLSPRGLSLVSHMRYQGDSADDFSDSAAFRLHNLYLRWSANPTWDLRIGRQFIAEGVGFGTYDVLRVKISPSDQASATLWGGLVAPPDRRAELQSTDNAPAFGLALRGKISSNIQITGSYLREEREGFLYRHRAGVSSNFDLPANFSGNALVYFNLSGPSDLHRARLLLRYGPAERFRLFGEFALGTPQLPPDSPFDFVEIETFQLVRLGGAYQISPNYWISLRAQTLLSGEQPNTTLGLSLDGPWGSAGYRQRFGDFGDESGFFGSARFQMTTHAQVYASADYSVYKFADQEENDDQAAMQLGTRLFPLRSLTLDASVQGLKNEQYKQDIRGLLRVKWAF